MPPISHVVACISFFVLLSTVSPTTACSEECPHISCENGYCRDHSDFCKSMKQYCENFFLRRCLRCACPKTCNVCGKSSSSSSSEEETTTTTSTTTTTTTTSTTTTTTSTTTDTTTTTTEAPVVLLTDKRVTCSSCDARREYLKQIYDKYYPKSNSNTYSASADNDNSTNVSQDNDGKESKR